jgi:hypothetical protein
MERLTIVLNLENAAFEDAPMSEAARILRKLADDMEECGPSNYRLRDLNGNTVGTASFES